MLVCEPTATATTLSSPFDNTTDHNSKNKRRHNSKVRLEKLTVAQRLKNLPVLYVKVTVYRDRSGWN
jgi:hypothetical protein